MRVAGRADRHRLRALRLVRRRAHRGADRKPTAAAGVFWGALSGFTSTISPGRRAAVPGVRAAAAAAEDDLRRHHDDILRRASTALKVVPYFALGQFSTKGFVTSLVLLPLAVATNFLGIWLVRITPKEHVLQDRSTAHHARRSVDRICSAARASIADILDRH